MTTEVIEDLSEKTPTTIIFCRFIDKNFFFIEFA